MHKTCQHFTSLIPDTETNFQAVCTIYANKETVIQTEVIILQTEIQNKVI